MITLARIKGGWVSFFAQSLGFYCLEFQYLFKEKVLCETKCENLQSLLL